MGKVLLGIVATLLVLAATALVYARVTGWSAQQPPLPLERQATGFVRTFAMPGDAKRRVNPVPASPGVLADGLAHYADHCAFCHGEDGAGSEIGRGMFPPVPDMRGAGTQQMTDGELFYAIEHGVRLTGMPAFATGTPEGEASSWRLVHFLRRLPQLTEDERDQIASLTPRSAQQVREEIAEEKFLRGEQP